MVLKMLEMIEGVIDSVKGRVRRRYALDRLQIIAYPGFCNKDTMFVRGRVLVGKDIESSNEEHGRMRNFRNMAKRFFSAEIPHAQLEVHWQGQEKAINADHEGFFFAELPLESGKTAEAVFHNLEPATSEPVKTEAKIFPCHENSDLAIVSDVDDTILLTMARKAIRMVALTLFGNAHSRRSFAGVANWYQALRLGADGKQNNPFFYVSSSPWNLYDFLEEFLEVNGIPAGPFFLRDHGFGAKGTHRSHKTNAIQQLLKTYPDKPFLLIGDSGQHDPEIYLDIVKEHPGRIKGILIRNVTGMLPLRHQEVERLGKEMEELGCSFKFFERTEQALDACWRWRLIHTGVPASSVSELPKPTITPNEDRPV